MELEVQHLRCKATYRYLYLKVTLLLLYYYNCNSSRWRQWVPVSRPSPSLSPWQRQISSIVTGRTVTSAARGLEKRLLCYRSLVFSCLTVLLRGDISCSLWSSRRQRETPSSSVNNMAPRQQHPRLLLLCVALSFAVSGGDARSSPISDLKSKISGVEELLEEFRKQLQQDQASRAGDAIDSCVGDFGAVGERIIRTKASIEQGAAFLLAPDRVYTWKDCLHACCSHPHCTVAVVQEDVRQPGDSLGCYLFNCTYRSKNVCSFAPQPGFSTYSWAPNATQGHPPVSPSGTARRLGDGDVDEAQGGRPAGTNLSLNPPPPPSFWLLHKAHAVSTLLTRICRGDMRNGRNNFSRFNIIILISWFERYHIFMWAFQPTVHQG